MYIKKITIYSKQPRKIIYRKKKLDMSLLVIMFIISSFDEKENKLNHYRGNDCIERLCKNLKESATEIINREKRLH